MRGVARVIAIILAIVFALAADGYGQETAEELFQAGLYQEQVQGNLRSAIGLFQRIVEDHSHRRRVAAEALLHIGYCHEKLGEREAVQAYRRLLRDYPEQTEVVNRARARLSAFLELALDDPEPEPVGASGIVLREVWAGRTGVEADVSGGPSPDGRYLAHVDWSATGTNIAIRDLRSGESRRLTDLPGYDEGMAGGAMISPDGETVAYAWRPKARPAQLRLVSMDGQRSRTLCSDPDFRYRPLHWASDGRRIMGTRVGEEEDEAVEFIWASVDDCTVNVFKAFHIDFGASTTSLSPDDRYLAIEHPVPRDSARRDILLLATDGGLEEPMVEHPANDWLVGWLPNTNHLLFVSDRGGTWDLWSVEVVEGEVLSPPRITRRGVGTMVPLGFTADGSLFYFLSTLRFTTSLAPFDAALGQVDLGQAQPLLGSILQPDWSPSGRYMAYWRKEDRPAGPSSWDQILAVRDVETGEERRLATDLEVEMPSWSPDEESILAIAAQRERQARNEAALFRIDAESGEPTLLVQFPADPSWKWGLGAIWSADGKGVIYARRGRLVLRDLASRREIEIYSHPDLANRLLTLSPDGRELLFAVGDSIADESERPRDYLRGGNGRLMIARLPGGPIRELVRLEGEGVAHFIQWAADGQEVYFTETTGDQTVLWRVPVTGGPPTRAWVAQQRLHNFAMHGGGRWVALTAGENEVEIWVMENLVAAVGHRR